ncbi:hypothetical protein WN944_028542 [Citrus x changshan-huyou]|uniref:Uncharacterized protein n=1 Tax=Citrus x changshan-huyou TaxID=2935761 RepID=A0AAP0Q9H8_9ROSI
MSQSPVIVEKVLNRKTLLVINCRGGELSHCFKVLSFYV